MSQPTYYRHDDASAPVLTGESGKLIDLLDAILVDGYGSKAAAGWTKPFSGTDKAVYRNSGTQTFVRVVDDNARFGSLGVAELWGYASMSDVDTGTGQFPTSANITSDPTQRKQITKSITTDSTSRKWVALATDKTLILCIEHGDEGALSSRVHFIGDYISLIPSDSANFALLASNWEEDTTPSASRQFFSPNQIAEGDLAVNNDLRTYYGALRQSAGSSAVTGSNAALDAFKIAGSTIATRSGGTVFDEPPHPIYGYPLTEIYLVDTTDEIIRGRLPSFMFVMANMDQDENSFTNYQDISISDPDEGSEDYIYAGHSERWNSSFTGAGGAYLLEKSAEDWP